MRGYPDKNHKHVPTGLVLRPGLVFRDVRKVWKRATRAEMRLELLKTLKAHNLSLPEVEMNVRRAAKQTHSLKFQSKHQQRNPVQIQQQMSHKLKDAYEAVRERRLERSEMKKRLNKILKKDPELRRNIFQQLGSEMKVLQSHISSKNDQKIKHLSSKFLPNVNSSSVPDDLNRFSGIKLYKE